MITGQAFGPALFFWGVTMADATFTGPKQKFTIAGLTFFHGVARPVPDDVVNVLSGHPWFDVIGEAPRKRGRKAQDDKE